MIFLLLTLLDILPGFSAETGLSIWSEFIPYSEIKAGLPELKKHNLSLNLAFHEDTDSITELADVLKTAGTLGVKVRPWILLSKGNGYWFNKWNAEVASTSTLRIVKELKEAGAPVDGIIFDLEPPQELVEEMQRAFDHKNPAAFLKVLRQSSRNGKLSDAEKKYSELLNTLHSQNIKVIAVASNYILHDKKSKRLESALGTPVSGVKWDEISFMVYRAEFNKFAGWTSPWIIENYAKRALKQFGPSVTLAIGEAGFVPYPKPFQGYSEAIELQRDMEAAHRGGVNNLQIYSWDGMKDQGLDYWLHPDADQVKMRKTLKASLLIKLLDSIHYFLPDSY